MAKTEAFAINLDNSRLDKLLHTQFLKIAVCPHVMVTLEEIHLHSPVHQVLEGRKNAHISLRNHITVLILEIPYVAEQIYGIRIRRKATEKVSEPTFTAGRISDLQTQMDICDEISGHDYLN